MKKLVSMLTVVIMVITMLSANVCADAQNPIYSHNFDSFVTSSNGTQLVSGHGFNNLANAVYNADDLNASTYLATRAVSGKGNSLEFIKGSTCSKAIELSLVGAPAWKGCSTIEFDVMREDLKGADFYIAYRSGSQMKFISFSREGKILVNAVDTGVTYSANTWYRVKMTMNITGGFAEILLNGGEHTNKIITASIPALTSLPNRLDIGFNYINTSGAAKANALIDNLIIYEDVLSGYDVYEKEGFDSFDEAKEFAPGGDGLHVSGGGGFTMRNYTSGTTSVTLTKGEDGNKFLKFVSGRKQPTLGKAVTNYGQNVAFEYTIGFDATGIERQTRLYLTNADGTAEYQYLVPKFAQPWVQVGAPVSPVTATDSLETTNSEFKVRALVDFTAHKMYVDIINLTTGVNLITNYEVAIDENATAIKEYRLMMGYNGGAGCTTTIDDIKFYSANAPRLLYTTPADKATDLGLYDSFSITANNELDLSTVASSNIKLTKNGVEIDSSKCKVVVDDERTFRIYPYAKYDANTTYTVSANGIKDIFGKALPSYQYTFTTGEDDGIGNVEFTLNGTPAETVGTGTMKASVDVSFNAPRDIILIIAKYTDNGEVLADMTVSTQKQQKSGTIEASVNVGDGEEDSVIKAFLWDGLNNARPYLVQEILGK